MQVQEQAEENLTRDGFLGKKLSILQPEQGFRSGHDAVLLAAFAAPPEAGTVLELGSGAGVASLCLAARRADVRVTGLELDAALVALAQQNAADNQLATRVDFRQGDVTGKFAALDLAPNQFDEVIANPPFYRAGEVNDLPNAGRQQAHIGDADTLAQWVSCACALVRAKGHVSFVHRAEALADLLAVMTPRLGGLCVMPIFPRLGAEATRVLLRGRRDSRAAMRVLPGVVLQDAQGQPSDAAEAVLRDGAALAFDTADG